VLPVSGETPDLHGLHELAIEPADAELELKTVGLGRV
jgi:hypothetical protein